MSEVIDAVSAAADDDMPGPATESGSPAAPGGAARPTAVPVPALNGPDLNLLGPREPGVQVADAVTRGAGPHGYASALAHPARPKERA